MPGIRFYLCDRRPIFQKQSRATVYKIREYQELLQNYCAKHDDCTFLSHAAYAPFFEEEGGADNYPYGRKELYVEDDIHFNQAGYDVYTEFFRRALDDIL